MFVFEADPPDVRKIPVDDIMGVTVVLLTCSYRSKEFIRVGYYVNNEYDDPELKENPPAEIQFQKLTRNILSSEVRETLSTLEDVKKWIPSILKDIEFYVNQMEVSCYPKKTIEEFEKRISQLRGEYKAFVRKSHELEPDLSATPWSDRPYSRKRQKIDEHGSGTETEAKLHISADIVTSRNHSNTSGFVPLSTPLLSEVKSCAEFYGSRKSDYHALPEVNMCSQDQPLDFSFTANTTREPGLSEVLKTSASLCGYDSSNGLKSNVVRDLEGTCELIHTAYDVETKKNSSSTNNSSLVHQDCPSNQSLNLPYSDSSSDEET
ncbi:histone chaperone asf1 [Elysia marginata]|uniref:Histone chaperone asf1 n=1 Tax=Elysia marginata TaxID=1093978 RepID=A0AAV4GM45_9GAST|nr:histone chaperone asf1 [Elysia marginata]